MLIEDLTDVARVQSDKFYLRLEAVDLVALTTRAVAVAQTLSNRQVIELDVDGTPPTVNGDVLRLQSALLNLLTNAIKFSEPAGRIEVRLRKADGEAELQVQDHGSGIPADQLAEIFQRFYQVARADRASLGGLGLGLFITKEIVTAHGGTVVVESEEGYGTTFTIRLPLPVEEAAIPAPSPAPSPAPFAAPSQ